MNQLALSPSKTTIMPPLYHQILAVNYHCVSGVVHVYIHIFQYIPIIYPIIYPINYISHYLSH